MLLFLEVDVLSGTVPAHLFINAPITLVFYRSKSKTLKRRIGAISVYIIFFLNNGVGICKGRYKQRHKPIERNFK